MSEVNRVWRLRKRPVGEIADDVLSFDNEPVPEFDASIEDKFKADVLRNRNNAQILERWDALGLPDSWLVAGCLFQTIWNLKSNRPPEASIKDYDIFYYDAADLSAEAERSVQRRAEALFSDLDITLELSNQARVHQWYEVHFGHPFPRLTSSKDGIDRFLIPSTCVGINPREVYTPNGLQSLYEGLLAMNPLTPHESLYEQKAQSYLQRWPWLRRVEHTESGSDVRVGTPT